MQSIFIRNLYKRGAALEKARIFLRYGVVCPYPGANLKRWQPLFISVKTYSLNSQGWGRRSHERWGNNVIDLG